MTYLLGFLLPQTQPSRKASVAASVAVRYAWLPVNAAIFKRAIVPFRAPPDIASYQIGNENAVLYSNVHPQ